MLSMSFALYGMGYLWDVEILDTALKTESTFLKNPGLSIDWYVRYHRVFAQNNDFR